MKAMVVGATGATGRQLVKHLLERGLEVSVIVRSLDGLPEETRNHENLTVIQESILNLCDADMATYVDGCGAVASCLGHNMTFRGIYGHPRMLVAESTRRLCEAIKSKKPEVPVKFVLMNTAGNVNLDASEKISFPQKCVIGIIRALLPPHPDNERAAEYLRTKIGQGDREIEWAAVRPDTLIDEDHIREYDVFPSPVRSAIFDPGKTSRINVGHFMAELITNDEVWKKWKGQMPVVYNKGFS